MTSLLQVTRAELIKLRSLRLVAVTAAATVVLTAFLSWLLTALTQQAFAAGRSVDAGGLEPGTALLPILHYAQIGPILLGAWALFQESDNDGLRTALLASPRRTVLFGAKALATLVVVSLIALPAVLLAYVARCSVIGCGSSTRLSADGTPDLGILGGYAVYWVILALFTFAVSTAVRNGLVGLVIVLTMVLAASQYLLRLTDLARFLPDQAGAELYQLSHGAGQLTASQGLAVLLAWLAVASVAALLSLRTWSAKGSQ